MTAAAWMLRVSWRISLVGAAVLMVGLSGCRTPYVSTASSELEAGPDTTVVIAPGDVVELKFFYAKDLNEILRASNTWTVDS